MSERTTKDAVDVVVVGSGAAGSVVSMTLARAGIRVVCLEQGDWWRPEAYPHTRTDWEWRRLTDWSTAVNVRRKPHDYPVDSTDENTLMWAGVGGATQIYTATWPRFRPSDFRKGVEHGLAPDWPYAYEDLAPYYEATDRLVGVSGWQGDPAMPPRERPPTRPVSASRMGRVAVRAFERLGWHWWPMPCAILGEDYDGRPACNNCGNCQNGCPRGSMNMAAITVWPKALAAGAELRTGARVERVETGPDGRATGVIYVDRASGTRYRQPADIVVLACNGVGTPRLLLLSASGKHPNGLANRSDQVGRNLMHHVLSIVEFWVDEPTDSHAGIISAAQICAEFAETDPARGFVNGLTIHVVRQNGAGYQALGSHSGNTAPWGARHHEHVRRHFGRSVGLLVVGDDLPQASNRVTLSDTLSDSSGLPAPAIRYQLHENDRRLIRFGIDRARDIAAAAEAFDVKVNDFGLSSTGYRPPAWHLLGTARMGSDPEQSVVDADHRAWDCPNLYIIDGSTMPSGAAVNPTSTIFAMAARAAERMVAHRRGTTPSSGR
jgi:choline dehydrogenase-like flavoprotein